MSPVRPLPFPRHLDANVCPACGTPDALCYVRAGPQTQQILRTRLDDLLLVEAAIAGDDAEFLRCNRCMCTWPVDLPILVVPPWNLDAVL